MGLGPPCILTDFKVYDNPRFSCSLLRSGGNPSGQFLNCSGSAKMLFQTYPRSRAAATPNDPTSRSPNRALRPHDRQTATPHGRSSCDGVARDCRPFWPRALRHAEYSVYAHSDSSPGGLNVDIEWGVNIPMAIGLTPRHVYRLYGRRIRCPSLHAHPYSATAIWSARSTSPDTGPLRSGGRAGAGTSGVFSSLPPTTQGLSRRREGSRKALVHGKVRDVGRVLRRSTIVLRRGAAPALSTIVPAASAHPGVDFPFSQILPVRLAVALLQERRYRTTGTYSALRLLGGKARESFARRGVSGASTGSSATRHRSSEVVRLRPRRVLRPMSPTPTVPADPAPS